MRILITFRLRYRRQTRAAASNKRIKANPPNALPTTTPIFSEPDNEDFGGELSDVTIAVNTVDPSSVITDVLVKETAPAVVSPDIDSVAVADVLDGVRESPAREDEEAGDIELEV